MVQFVNQIRNHRCSSNGGVESLHSGQEPKHVGLSVLDFLKKTAACPEVMQSLSAGHFDLRPLCNPSLPGLGPSSLHSRPNLTPVRHLLSLTSIVNILSCIQHRLVELRLSKERTPAMMARRLSWRASMVQRLIQRHRLVSLLQNRQRAQVKACEYSIRVFSASLSIFSGTPGGLTKGSFPEPWGWKEGPAPKAMKEYVNSVSMHFVCQ